MRNARRPCTATLVASRPSSKNTLTTGPWISTRNVTSATDLASSIGSKANAPGVVFGYAAGNDVSVRDWQFHTSQWILGKSFDTHAPFGPFLVTADEIGDPHTLGIRCFVNGEKRQDSNTSNLVFDVHDQIALLSQAMTLEPGDVIFTGTPGGVGFAAKPPRFLKAGDVVRVEIDRIGAIEARMVDET